jgi:dihydroneopterin aldolase
MWIRVQSLSLFAHHGAYDEEREKGNHFEIDADILVPDTFGSVDDLQSTLDYVSVFKIISKRSSEKRYILLERFCEDICNDVFALDDAISEVAVRVRKLNPPSDVMVKSVEVERRMVR